MKALVITVPDGFKTAVVTITYEGADGKNDLETKSTRGQDTNWILDFSETDKTEKSNKVTFEDYFRTVFPEYDERKGAVSEYCVGDFFNITCPSIACEDCWKREYSQNRQCKDGVREQITECNDCAIDPYCLVNVDGFRLKEAMQKKSTVEEEET